MRAVYAAYAGRAWSARPQSAGAAAADPAPSSAAPGAGDERRALGVRPFQTRSKLRSLSEGSESSLVSVRERGRVTILLEVYRQGGNRPDVLASAISHFDTIVSF